MSSVKPKGSSSSPQYVDLSPWSYAMWWFILFAVHAITCAYNAAYAMFYYELHDTYLYSCLEYSGIGMLAKDHRVIANVNVVLAAFHGACMLSMISASLWRRELAYSPFAQEGTHSTRSGRRKSSNKALVGPTADDRFGSRLISARVRTTQLYSDVWGRQGFLGVNGSKFHGILVARELLEMVLQTVQAYRMSWYLPRMLLNRFYLTLLVLNCWSSVVIYTLLYRRNEARRRFTCLLCDCILDLISCVGVPLIIVLSYIDELGNTSITELPQNVTNLSPTLSFIQLTNTNISFFWSWIDPLVERRLGMKSPLKMGGSPYCADREKITNGETNSFSVLPVNEYSPMLMDASEANRDVILQSVICEMRLAKTTYLIEFEDLHSALVV